MAESLKIITTDPALRAYRYSLQTAMRGIKDATGRMKDRLVDDLTRQVDISDPVPEVTPEMRQKALEIALSAEAGGLQKFSKLDKLKAMAIRHFGDDSIGNMAKVAQRLKDKEQVGPEIFASVDDIAKKMMSKPKVDMVVNNHGDLVPSGRWMGPRKLVGEDPWQVADEFLSGKRRFHRAKTGRNRADARGKLFREFSGYNQYNTAGEPLGPYLSVRDDLEDLMALIHGFEPQHNFKSVARLKAKDRRLGVIKKATFEPLKGNPPKVGAYGVDEWEAVLRDVFPKTRSNYSWWQDHVDKFMAGHGASVRVTDGLDEAVDELTIKLMDKHDMVIFPDIAARQPNLLQAVPLRPGHLVRTLGSSRRVFGTAATTALSAKMLESLLGSDTKPPNGRNLDTVR